MPSHSDQGLPFPETVAVVKPHNARGELSKAGWRLVDGSLQSEVLSPVVYP
jgi:hypothetical protein